MQSLLINGGNHGFPGDRESLLHLFNNGESSKDLQYKETDSQLEASELTLEHCRTSFAERNEELGFLLIRYTGVGNLLTIYLSRVF